MIARSCSILFCLPGLHTRHLHPPFSPKQEEAANDQQLKIIRLPQGESLLVLLIFLPVKAKKRRGKKPRRSKFLVVRPTGIEPVHLAPEASALSPELRAPAFLF